MEEEVLPGDLDAGEVIMLSGARHELLVKAVRLGQGGFILTVTPIDDDTPGAEQLITLTGSDAPSQTPLSDAGLHGGDLPAAPRGPIR